MGYSRKWNKPSGEDATARLKRHIGSAWMRTCIVAAIVVCGVGIALWRQSHSSPSEKPVQKPVHNKKHIDSPKLNQSPRTAAPKKGKPELAIDERRTVNGKIIKVPKNPFGTPIPKDLEYKPLWEYTPEDYARVDPGYAERHERFLKAQAANPWKTPADRSLAMLVFAKNGNMGLLIPFDARFKDKFIDSLNTPIVIDPEDSDELKQQKEDMIAVRQYLKEQMDEGKDIVAILNEEYQANKRHHELRENLLKELREFEKTATSVEEVQEYVKAANAMLEREGAGKIGLPLALTRYRLNKLSANEGGMK